MFSCDHVGGTRYVDWAEGEWLLNEIIYECQQSLKAIEHGKIVQEARSWAQSLLATRPTAHPWQLDGFRDVTKIAFSTGCWLPAAN